MIGGLFESKPGLLRQPVPVSHKCAFIESQEGGKFSVYQMCRWAKVARSWYQVWKRHTPTDTGRWHQRLTALVIDIFAASGQTYGYRRVTAEAARRGPTPTRSGPVRQFFTPIAEYNICRLLRGVGCPS